MFADKTKHLKLKKKNSRNIQYNAKIRRTSAIYVELIIVRFCGLNNVHNIYILFCLNAELYIILYFNCIFLINNNKLKKWHNLNM